jgi:hypothetical protein
MIPFMVFMVVLCVGIVLLSAYCFARYAEDQGIP